jgi:hypothetical protein
MQHRISLVGVKCSQIYGCWGLRMRH